MFPDLIDLGFLHLKTYGACMATGFLLCWMLIEKLSGRKDLSNLLLSLMIGGVAGSRIAYVIEHWQSEFASNPAAIIRVDQGGLMFYGGFILSFVIFFVWCFRHQGPSLLAGNDGLCRASLAQLIAIFAWLINIHIMVRMLNQPWTDPSGA